MNQILDKKETAHKIRKMSMHSGVSDSTDDQCPEDSPVKDNIKNFQNPKYKTELCRNFRQTGFCPYYEKCQFAHGYEELEWSDQATSIDECRNRRCIKFWATGECRYGTRCKFRHHEINRNTLNSLRIHAAVIENSLDHKIVNYGSRLLSSLYQGFEQPLTPQFVS